MQAQLSPPTDIIPTDQEHRKKADCLYDPHIWKQVGGTAVSLEAAVKTN